MINYLGVLKGFLEALYSGIYSDIGCYAYVGNSHNKYTYVNARTTTLCNHNMPRYKNCYVMFAYCV